MTISLKDFVSQTIHDVLHGILDAQRDREIAKYIAPWGIGAIEFPVDSGVTRRGPFSATVVKFDILISAEASGSTRGSGSVKVVVFDVGVQGGMDSKNVATHHIQFGVPISFPPGDGDPAHYTAQNDVVQET